MIEKFQFNCCPKLKIENEGVIVNNCMTWEHHLYGNTEHKGLIPKLSNRAKLIWKLSIMMPQKRLKMIAEGIFF